MVLMLYVVSFWTDDFWRGEGRGERNVGGEMGAYIQILICMISQVGSAASGAV